VNSVFGTANIQEELLANEQENDHKDTDRENDNPAKPTTFNFEEASG